MAPNINPFSDDLRLLTDRHRAIVERGIRGGADDAPPELPPIPDVPEDLAALDEAGLRELHSQLQAARDARAPEAHSRELVEEIAAIHEAQQRLVGAVTELHQNAAAVEALNTETPVMPDAPVVPDSPAALENAGTPPVDPTVPDGEGEDAPGGEAVLAPAGAVAALDGQTPADFASTGNPAPPIPARTRPHAALIAAAGPASNVDFGSDLGSDLGSLGRAMAETFAALRPARDGSAMRARVATISAYEDMGDSLGVALLGSGNAEQNTALIHEAVDSYFALLPERYGGKPSAQVAAICDPLDIIREIPDCVTDAEPFSDTLPGRAAGRLGFQFMPSSVLGDVNAGVQIWTEADQAAVDPDDSTTWKPCVLVTCPSVEEVIAEAITACLTFDNTTEMSSPERVKDFLSKIAAAKARAKEDRLLTIASTFTHRYRHVGEYGAVPSSVLGVLTTLEQGWATNRLDEATLYNWYIPKEVLSAWVIDLEGRAFGSQDLDAGNGYDVVGYMEGVFRAAGKNVRIVPLLDRSITPTLPIIGGVAEEYLESGLKAGPYETYLIPPEGAIYFSTGELNVGVERSPELMRQNRAQWFAEEYVGLAKHGCQPWYRLQLDICENGTRAALTTPFACEGAS